LDLEGGETIGPAIADTWGYPVQTRVDARARDPRRATRLWELSRELTGVDYRSLEQ
jgi:hypothetical protein